MGTLEIFKIYFLLLTTVGSSAGLLLGPLGMVITIPIAWYFGIRKFNMTYNTEYGINSFNDNNIGVGKKPAKKKRIPSRDRVGVALQENALRVLSEIMGR